MNDPLKCGDCGGDTFTLSHDRARSAPRVGGGGIDDHTGATVVHGDLFVKCVKCGRSTIISVATTRLTVQGNMCGGWSKEKS